MISDYTGHSTTDQFAQENYPAYPSRWHEQRKYPRSYYEQGKRVSFRVRDENGEIFEPCAFLFDESVKGLGLLVVTSQTLSPNQLCEVNVAKMGWLSCRIIWSQFISESLQEIGVTYRN